MKLTDFRTIGRSGLVVNPLALGTMTFGNREWGSSGDVSKDIFNRYVERGGNFLDTADVYSEGRSEELLGEYIAERKLRDQVVLATKSSFHAGPAGNVNAGGNGRKNINRAIEGSLRRLRTDYIDLYWMHTWDRVTPAEEALESFGDLVRVGKVRYFGFSNVPAWYTAKAATLAAAHAIPGPIALQLEYSLVERNIENEHIPAAREFGIGVIPWSPLAGGFLSGKYRRDDTEKKVGDQGRLNRDNPFGASKFTGRNWQILDALKGVAKEVGRPLSQVALAWSLAQPGVTSLLLGASKPEQLDDNLASLELQLSPEQLRTLDESSTLAPTYPYPIFSDEINEMIFTGKVQGWQ